MKIEISKVAIASFALVVFELGINYADRVMVR